MMFHILIYFWWYTTYICAYFDFSSIVAIYYTTWSDTNGKISILLVDAGDNIQGVALARYQSALYQVKCYKLIMTLIFLGMLCAYEICDAVVVPMEG